MEITNVNDLVGFCPHEDLTGQGGKTDKFCGFMVPGQFKMSFTGKRLTIPDAKITSGKAKKAAAKRVIAARPMHAPARVEEPAVEPAAPVEPVAEVVVKAEVDPVDDTPVEADADASVTDTPVKKARKSRKKA